MGQKRALGPVRVLCRRFQRVGGTDNETVFRRVLPEADNLAEYHVAEIVERHYASPERAMQGLFRGEISMLPDLPTWVVSLVRNDQRFFVINYALPTTHVLQFNPQSEPLRSRELRLAMAYSRSRRSEPALGNWAARPEDTIRTTGDGTFRHDELRL